MRSRFALGSLGALAIALSTAGAALAQDADVLAQQVVSLFDELVACSSDMGFPIAGLSANGPCAEWLIRVEAAQALDSTLIEAGVYCLAGDIRLAGNALVAGDREFFDFVADLVDECRHEIARSG